jgi:hypothetical protein
MSKKEDQLRIAARKLNAALNKFNRDTRSVPLRDAVHEAKDEIISAALEFARSKKNIRREAIDAGLISKEKQ